jgi:hypothetical protein
MTQTSRNLLIFPNLIINDIMAITVRTFFPVTPDYLEINAWALAPKDETPDNRALRLDNFLTFLGPGGFATPDDVEALESCQQGFANREVEWSDMSRGMQRAQPSWMTSSRCAPSGANGTRSCGTLRCCARLLRRATYPRHTGGSISRAQHLRYAVPSVARGTWLL